jgi:cell division protein ZapE
MPPREFETSRFENYLPDPNFPSQMAALDLAQQFTAPISRLKRKTSEPNPGIYLDGGFGVGKTHLLASIWHDFKGSKAFGSFLDFTSLVGYLGFAQALTQLGQYKLICIDEFELDDPGDTMIMSRLLKELSLKGVRFAATSNTPPNALGEGRFAAADFKREIQGLGERFQMVSIDGEDYRHRDSETHTESLSHAGLEGWVLQQDNGYLDPLDQLLKHLASLHPTKYRALVSKATGVGISSFHQLEDQGQALRFVGFIDRLYEAKVPLRTQGEVPATMVFSDTMKLGGYRKKYLRAVSRIGALSEL